VKKPIKFSIVFKNGTCQRLTSISYTFYNLDIMIVSILFSQLLL